MPTRKRNDEEQALHDHIEALKVERRTLVARREASLSELMGLTSKHSNTFLATAARHVLERAEAVKDLDQRVADERKKYEALRAKNDARN